MFGYTDVEELLAVHSEDPPVLSLYLQMPERLPALRAAPARAGELLAATADGLDGHDAERVLARAGRTVRSFLEAGARYWLGHEVAMFCGPAGLSTAIRVPAGLGERAVFASRPHVRPLLAALQRRPGYHVAVAAPQRAWLFAVAGERIETVTPLTAPGMPGSRSSGWHGLGSARASEHLGSFPHLTFGEAAVILAGGMRTGSHRLVIGGLPDAVPAFLASLPGGVRDRFAGSFISNPMTVSPARARALAEPLVRNWVERSERHLADWVRQEPGNGHAAVGLAACLRAVSQDAVSTLVVPDQGLLPGRACRRCGALGTTTTGCADGDAAASAIPDLIEEMAVRTIQAGGGVETVTGPPGGIAACLRAPIRRAGRLAA